MIYTWQKECLCICNKNTIYTSVQYDPDFCCLPVQYTAFHDAVSVDRNNLNQSLWKYCIYSKYLDRQQAWPHRPNNVDPDQMLQNAASVLGLHCLPLVQQTSTINKNGLIQIKERSDKVLNISGEYDRGWSGLSVLHAQSTLGKNFSRQQIDHIFLILPRKQILIFHANCLHQRQFAWNVKSCFLRKIRKISSICCLLNLPREW